MGFWKMDHRHIIWKIRWGGFKRGTVSGYAEKETLLMIVILMILMIFIITDHFGEKVDTRPVLDGGFLPVLEGGFYTLGSRSCKYLSRKAYHLIYKP